jgi:hypothetical protein
MEKMEQIKICVDELIKNKDCEDWRSAPRWFFDFQGNFSFIETRKEDETIRQYERRMEEIYRTLKRKYEAKPTDVYNNIVYMKPLTNQTLSDMTYCGCR